MILVTSEEGTQPRVTGLAYVLHDYAPRLLQEPMYECYDTNGDHCLPFIPLGYDLNEIIPPDALQQIKNEIILDVKQQSN